MTKGTDCGCGSHKAQDTMGSKKNDPLKNSTKLDQKVAPEQGQSSAR